MSAGLARLIVAGESWRLSSEHLTALQQRKSLFLSAEEEVSQERIRFGACHPCAHDRRLQGDEASRIAALESRTERELGVVAA